MKKNSETLQTSTETCFALLKWTNISFLQELLCKAVLYLQGGCHTPHMNDHTSVNLLKFKIDDVHTPIFFFFHFFAAPFLKESHSKLT